jgi:carboxyl-terminal processing protease
MLSWKPRQRRLEYLVIAIKNTMQPFSRKLFGLSATLLSGLVVSNTALTVVAAPLREAAAGTKFQDNPKAIVDEAWQIVNREYVDATFNKTNWQQVRQELLNRKYSNKLEAYAAIRQALRKLDDPYTRFMDPQQYQALTTQTNGEVTGIGIKLQEPEESASASSSEPKNLIIAEVVEKSPAALAGLQSGDRVLAIDGRSTVQMTTNEAAKLIRGEDGNSLKLKLLRVGKGTFEVSLKRTQIEVSSVAYRVKQENKVKVGYIKLVEFSSHSTKQMEDAIRALNREKVNAFILDLRGNPGGLLQNSIEITRLFLSSGVIVKTVDRQGSNEQFRANQTAITELPLAVLVDGNSASASEIMAGALKDNKRGTIVGTSTFGKALVQSVHALKDGSGMAVTVAHYYTPNGTDIGHKGVSPDIRVDDGGYSRSFGEYGETAGSSNDIAYQSAVNLFQNTRPAAVSRNP